MLLAVPLLVGWLRLDPEEAPARLALQGIWDRVDAEDGPPVQFYYFHTDDSGLYRFGSTDLNHTEMFRHRWRRGGLEIVFRKTGERWVSAVHEAKDAAGGRVLVIESDPRNDGRPTRYRLRTGAGPRLEAAGPVPGSKDGFARMWMHRRDLVKGRLDFRIYQFQPASESGHGTGWFHHGDFEEWTTESLRYHRGDKGLHLHFIQRDEWGYSSFEVAERDGRRLLRLERDPRYFGRASEYRDAGPTLMMSGVALPSGPMWPEGPAAVSTETP